MKKESVTLTEAGKRLGVARCSIVTAVRRGRLAPVYGGLMGDRLVGVTRESLERLLDLRKRKAANG